MFIEDDWFDLTDEALDRPLTSEEAFELVLDDIPKDVHPIAPALRAALDELQFDFDEVMSDYMRPEALPYESEVELIALSRMLGDDLINDLLAFVKRFKESR